MDTGGVEGWTVKDGIDTDNSAHVWSSQKISKQEKWIHSFIKYPVLAIYPQYFKCNLHLSYLNIH